MSVRVRFPSHCARRGGLLTGPSPVPALVLARQANAKSLRVVSCYRRRSSIGPHDRLVNLKAFAPDWGDDDAPHVYEKRNQWFMSGTRQHRQGDACRRQAGLPFTARRQLKRPGRPYTKAIYTKVAVLRQQQIQSPLDVLNGKARPALALPAQKPVGRMQIDVRLRPGDPTTADAEAIIFSEDRYVHLDGIVVQNVGGPSTGLSTS